MSTLLKKKDIRIVKTNKTLVKALLDLLDKRSFKKIAVNDICEEALISRAAFYAHFNSKYDLLQYWIQCVMQDVPDDISAYSEAHITEGMNLFVDKHKRVIRNIVEDSDELILDMFQCLTLLVINKFNALEPGDTSNKMLSIFCAGGIYSLLKWHAKNRFMSDIELNNVLRLIMEKQ